MGRTLTLHSIVLHAYNVGEADRFCILLSRERGMVAARAHGVRKPKSRIGGNILPLQELMITVRDGSSGLHITDCKIMYDYASSLQVRSFLHATQCAEMLLALLEDDHPVPEIFECTQAFLHACHREKSQSTLPFTIQLLWTLGLLPSQENHSLFDHCTQEEKLFLQQVLRDNWAQAQLPTSSVQHLHMLCARIIEEHSRRPLKAAGVAMVM